MKFQKRLTISLMIVISGAGLFYVVSRLGILFPAAPENSPEQVESTSLQAQSVTIGSVSYKVTPQNLAAPGETWDFAVTLDTHAGDLDQDAVALIRLIDDQGKSYRALAWEGDPPGGHHREGVLRFAPLLPRPAFIEVRIETAGEAPATPLRWNLHQ
jgi:hypothetical protein